MGLCNSAENNPAGNVFEDRKMSGVSNMTSEDEEVEAVVCLEGDLPDDGMKCFDIEGGRVLIVKHQGNLSAIGSKCSHYGAPLEKGVVANGRVRCPWHGACFSLATGDIEDFPGLDSIPSYNITIDNGNVKVRAKRSLLATNKRIKAMSKRDPENEKIFVIIGGGAAGSKCCETLRQEGFTGRLVMVSAENHLPYDRPKLSKAMNLSADMIALRTRQFYEDGDIELMLGVTAEAVDGEAREVTLSSGSKLLFDKLFIATGGRARLPGCDGDNLTGVYVIRTPEDANHINEVARGKDVIVIGTSFIGMEGAAFLASGGLASSVTIIGRSSVPFKTSLGEVVGMRIQKLFEEKGVKFYNSETVSEITGKEGHVTGVVLGSGTILKADLVVAGVGVVPTTEFLSGSGITVDPKGFVPVDKCLETNISGVFCGGDIALFPMFLHDDASVNIGHWQVAQGHGHVAAFNMLNKRLEVKSTPFFWTVLFGKSLRYTGHGDFDDVIISGDVEELSFVAYYCSGNKVVALASLMRDPAAAKYAEMLQNQLFLTKEEVQDDKEIINKL